MVNPNAVVVSNIENFFIALFYNVGTRCCNIARSRAFATDLTETAKFSDKLWVHMAIARDTEIASRSRILRISCAT